MALARRRTIVSRMGSLALALHLVVASPGLVPTLDPGPFRADPGPFRAGELAGASLGVFMGDALVLAGGYATLRLFANGTIDPTASNFRTAAYAFGAAAILVPPLTAVLVARWMRAKPASGAAWKALLLASVAHSAALAAGYAASPRVWVVLPVQLVGVAVGTSLGLHWGPRARPPPPLGGELRREPASLPAPEAARSAPEAAGRLTAPQCAVG